MSSKREFKIRKYAFKIYYSFLQSDEKIEVIANSMVRHNNAEKELVERGIEIINASIEKIDYSDNLISKYLRKDWSIDRLPLLDLIILRLAIYEIFQSKDVIKVIDDYVSISSRYSEPMSPDYINGILEKIKKDFGLGK
ncbi:MAG: transcription antitermination factor NusB [Calditerrivibrio sp.]|nr:transcription antitermination factor NusB [Calditerrivibrio sp.]MCA1932157.1 transcription antitermination factor NusB [Calditerrivibrio sp.]MCA1980134.1 transcription antitermination factor NusB [Calditerrivibrio sp.]